MQLGRHRRRVRRDTTAGWPCTSNAHKAAVVHYKCIEGDVKPRCYAAQMLDRINLLSDGAIGVRRATPLPRRRKTLADRGPDRQPLLPKPMGDGDKIGRLRAFPALIFGNLGLMYLLGRYTKRHWQRDGVRTLLCQCGRCTLRSLENQVPWHSFDGRRLSEHNLCHPSKMTNFHTPRMILKLKQTI